MSLNHNQTNAFELAKQLGFGPITFMQNGRETTQRYGLKIGDVVLTMNAFPKNVGIAYYNSVRGKGGCSISQYRNFEEKLKNVVDYYQKKYSEKIT